MLVEVGLRLKRAETALRCGGGVQEGERVFLLGVVEQGKILAVAPCPGVRPVEFGLFIAGKLRVPGVHAGRDVARDFDELLVGGRAFEGVFL